MFKSMMGKDMQNLDNYSRGARTKNKTDFGSKFSQVGLGPGQSVHTYLVDIQRKQIGLILIFD